MYNQVYKSYEREILPQEAIFIRSPGALIAIVAQVAGYIEDDKFKEAVKKLRKIYPILNTVLKWHENGQVWLRETKKDFNINIIFRNSDMDFEDIIKNEWTKSFDLENGPLTRFILLKSSTKSEIIFITHHLISDGIGMTIIIDTILQLLNDPNMEFDIDHEHNLPSYKNLIKYVEKRNLSSYFRNLLNSSISYFLTYRWNRSKIHMEPKDIIKSHESLFKSHEYIVVTDEFTEQSTSSLIEKCKKYNVTVNSAMTIAFLKCRSEIDKGHKNFNQLVPVDLRRHLSKNKRSINCHATSIHIKYKYNPSTSFWDNTKQYDKKVKSALKDHKDISQVQRISTFPIDLIEASILSQRIQSLPEVYYDYFKDYYKKLGSKSNHVASIIAKSALNIIPASSITNLGQAKLSGNYGSISLEKIFVYPSGIAYPKNSIIISAITLNNKLMLAYHTIINKFDKEAHEYKNMILKLKERFKEILIYDIHI